MDLLSTVRKQGSRGGVNFSWEEVATSPHREYYLGHSIKAPVGRWAQGRDLTWYAKADSRGTDLNETEDERNARERREEIRKIKEAEEDAIARALGLPVKQRDTTGANAIEVAERKVPDTKEEELAKAARFMRREEKANNDRKEHSDRKHRDPESHRRRHRSRSRDRDRERKHRSGRDQSSERDRRRDRSRERRHRDDEERDSGRRRSRDREGDSHRRERRPGPEVDRARARSRSRDRDGDRDRASARHQGRSRTRDRGRLRSPQRRRSRSPI